MKALNRDAQAGLWELRSDSERNQKILVSRHEQVVQRQTEVAKSLRASASKHHDQESMLAKMQARIARLEQAASTSAAAEHHARGMHGHESRPAEPTAAVQQPQPQPEARGAGK